jgi:hypothetical protein
VSGCPLPFSQGQYFLTPVMSGYASFYSWQSVSPLYLLSV